MLAVQLPRDPLYLKLNIEGSREKHLEKFQKKYVPLGYHLVFRHVGPI